MDGGREPFAEQLRSLRVAAALSQEELAARAGLSARAISDLERGVRQGPRPESLRLLADALSLEGGDREAFVASAQLERRAKPATGAAHSSALLPQPPTPLLGRDRELEKLCALVSRQDVRLVTLTGLGGIGKTRLAIAVAHKLAATFADAVIFVDLAPLSDPTLVMPTLAASLGIHESGEQPIVQRVLQALAARQMLVLLDNCEQVLAAAPDIAEVMVASPGLTLLATSREALKLRGEWEWPVTPLALPDLDGPTTVSELKQSPAVALFVDRATASHPQFILGEENAQAVATICHRVDGIPLAIELAAARSKLLSPEHLASRLDQRLSLLTGGARDAPARQRTLYDALAWSYDLLTPEEQTLFRRLGVFVGGWTLEAAEAVAHPGESLSVLDRLGSLLDKSLLYRDERGSVPRYSMLETVREFALEQLMAENERAEIRELHAAYFLEFVVRRPTAQDASSKHPWYKVLEAEHPNLRAALATLNRDEDADRHVRLVMALTWFWFARSHAAEGLPHLAHALARERAPTSTRARLLSDAGNLAYACGEYNLAESWLKEGEALARDHNQQSLAASCILLRGAVAEHLGDEAGAQAFFETGLALAWEIGADWLIGEFLPNLSDAAYRRGELDLAERYAREAMDALAVSSSWYFESMNFGNIAQVALARGMVAGAAEAFAHALGIAEEKDSRLNLANGMAGAAAVSAALGDREQAARLLGAADAERVRSGHPRLPHFGLFQQTQEALRDALGEAAYQAGWDAGHALGTNEAVAEAHSVLMGVLRVK